MLGLVGLVVVVAEERVCSPCCCLVRCPMQFGANEFVDSCSSERRLLVVVRRLLVVVRRLLVVVRQLLVVVRRLLVVVQQLFG